MPTVIAIHRERHVFERLIALHYTSPSGTLGSALLLEYSLMDLQPVFHVVNKGRGGIGLFFVEDVFRRATLPRRARSLGDLPAIFARRIGYRGKACPLRQPQPLLLDAPQRRTQRGR